ncbi:MAG: type II toxin-antitoxin system Phd/YefM family antitoxin [Gammaproteobacteria bacterium]
MKTITSTELARNLRQILDQLATEGGEVVIERNRRPVACIVGVTPRQTALQAMADLYRTLPEDAAASWEQDSRLALGGEHTESGVRDPWVS